MRPWVITTGDRGRNEIFGPIVMVVQTLNQQCGQAIPDGDPKPLRLQANTLGLTKILKRQTLFYLEPKPWAKSRQCISAV